MRRVKSFLAAALDVSVLLVAAILLSAGPVLADETIGGSCPGGAGAPQSANGNNVV
jgi:hypothetical protein